MKEFIESCHKLNNTIMKNIENSISYFNINVRFDLVVYRIKIQQFKYDFEVNYTFEEILHYNTDELYNRLKSIIPILKTIKPRYIDTDNITSILENNIFNIEELILMRRMAKSFINKSVKSKEELKPELNLLSKIKSELNAVYGTEENPCK